MAKALEGSHTVHGVRGLPEALGLGEAAQAARGAQSRVGVGGARSPPKKRKMR